MRIHRFAAWALIAALAFLATPAISSASPSDDVITAVKVAIQAMNKGDMDAFVASCNSPAFIIDTFPPYVTSGATACADWWNTRAVYNKKAQISDATAGIGAPWHVFVSGSEAYVAAPFDYHYNQKGSTVRETGSILTVTLTKKANGWLITSWAHTKHLES